MANKFFSLIFFLSFFVSDVLAADVHCAQDDDGNGTVDFWCSTTDADRDSFESSIDCDDNNDSIKPDNTTFHTQGCSGGQVKYCKEDGTGWSSCADWSCDATGSGACYFVDCSSGSDSNNGSVGSPWATVKMFSRYISGAPSGHHTPVPGDRFYLKNCTNYTTTYDRGDGLIRMLEIRADGTSTDRIKISPFPGHTTKFSSTAPTKSGAPLCIYSEAAEYWTVQGIELDQCAMWIADDSNYYRIWDMKIHGADGIEADNLAGIKVNASSNIDIRWNKLWDNYDRTPTNENANSVCGIDLYRVHGSSSIISWNKIHSTTEDTCAHAIRFKHCDGSSSDLPIVHGNSAVRTNGGTAQPIAYDSCMHLDFKYNFFYGNADGYFLRFADVGGPANFQQSGIVKYNTSIGPKAILYAPSKEYDSTGTACNNCNSLGTQEIRENIFKVASASLDGTEGVIELCQYGSDDYFVDIIDNDKITFVDNTYWLPSITFKALVFNSNTATAGLCARTTSPVGTVEGATLSDFAAWQGYTDLPSDTTGEVEDPNFNSNYIAQSANSLSKGWNKYLTGTSGSINIFKNSTSRKLKNRISKYN